MNSIETKRNENYNLNQSFSDEFTLTTEIFSFSESPVFLDFLLFFFVVVPFFELSWSLDVFFLADDFSTAVVFSVETIICSSLFWVSLCC